MALLPGMLVKLEEGSYCENDHGDEEVLAAVTIVGETDSFGSEFISLCQACYDAEQDEDPEPMICDYCKKEAVCQPTRDPDEGANGPVYWVCSPCKAEQNKRLMEENDRYYQEKEEEQDSMYW